MSKGVCSFKEVTGRKIPHFTGESASHAKRCKPDWLKAVIDYKSLAEVETNISPEATEFICKNRYHNVHLCFPKQKFKIIFNLLSYPRNAAIFAAEITGWEGGLS
ncbi:hypothetical protein F7734_60115 [Scytonema sp. UIC 10036]|nr:hypothetical protein [Scytonema sp. UIC 10036]MUH01833.1 hypothetical protein [Scytonema sp. UIC 10036]